MPSSDTPNIASDTPVQMASVFMAQDNIAIHSLSTQTATANATVTYELYSLNPNYSAPADGTLIAAKTESYPFAGYYRLALDSFYAFKKGLPLSIIVTTKRADGTYEINYDKEAFKFGPQVSNTLFSL